MHCPISTQVEGGFNYFLNQQEHYSQQFWFFYSGHEYYVFPGYHRACFGVEMGISGGDSRKVLHIYSMEDAASADV